MMVRLTRRLSAASSLTLAVAAISLSGCAQVLGAGRGLLGRGDHGRDPSRPTAAAKPLEKPARSSPSVAPRTYESAPAYGLGGLGTARPASVAAFMSRAAGVDPCGLASPGLMRVLPFDRAAPVRPLAQMGPLTVGVGGPGTEPLGDVWALDGLGLAATAMQQTAELGTHEGCTRSLFAFVSLGSGRSYDPVVVR